MTAQERYGTLVWHAVCDLTSGTVDGFEVWASASAVGEKAEVSTMTARKYLKILSDASMVESRSFMGITGYRVHGNADPRPDLS